jgi:hypothetical protein
MAISNFPYDDVAIVDGVKTVAVHSKDVSQVSVDFLTNHIGDDTTAKVTATITWTITSADAVRLLDAARPATTFAPTDGTPTL